METFRNSQPLMIKPPRWKIFCSSCTARWPRMSYGRTQARNSFRTLSWPSREVWWTGSSNLPSTRIRTGTYSVTSKCSCLWWTKGYPSQPRSLDKLFMRHGIWVVKEKIRVSFLHLSELPDRKEGKRCVLRDAGSWAGGPCILAWPLWKALLFTLPQLFVPSFFYLLLPFRSGLRPHFLRGNPS